MKIGIGRKMCTDQSNSNSSNINVNLIYNDINHFTLIGVRVLPPVYTTAEMRLFNEV